MAQSPKAVGVFMYDGTDKYSTMTINAIKSFLAVASKNIQIGILVPPNLKQPDWSFHFGAENRSRLDVRFFKEHFSNWNPTQHKLDIQQFADAYEIVVWLDSDTVFFDDINQLILNFAKSNSTVALVEDLVTSKPGFQERWANATRSSNLHPFVPQTAVMAFKQAGFEKIFATWETTWRKWIEPAPFANFGDPDPAFIGSAFCIEQYALGLTLEQLGLLNDGSLYRIERRQVLFKDVRSATGVGQVFQIPFSVLMSGQGNSSSAGSYQLGSYQVGSYQTGSAQVGSYQVGSYQLSGAQQVGSYQLSSGSYQVGSYQIGSYQVGSYQVGSLQIGSLQAGLSSLQLGSYRPGVPVGSYAFNESIKVNEALTNTGYIGVIPVNSGLNYDIVVDSFAGSMLHFYSFNYQPGYKIYSENQDKIQPTLQQLWK